MSDVNRIGPVVTGHDVEQAVKATLNLWASFYIGEMERLQGYPADSVQRALGSVTASEFEKWPEDQLPVYIVICPGLSGQPERRSDGTWAASFAVGVGVVASDLDEASTRKLAETHTAAIRLAVMQHKTLGGFATETNWRDERYDDLPFQDTRSLGSGRVTFEVSVEGVMRESGPRTLPTPPPSADPGPWPNVSEVDVNVELEAITA